MFVSAKRGILLLLLLLCYRSPLLAQTVESCPVAATKLSASVSLNINNATLEELSSKLKGIGKAKAAAMIEWRTTNGKFSSLEDVDEVRGIGPAILEKNRALIRFED